ncbi:MAG: hypothetical protein Kow0047_03890 [Anaerolineae bacterium]
MARTAFFGGKIAALTSLIALVLTRPVFAQGAGPLLGQAGVDGAEATFLPDYAAVAPAAPELIEPVGWQTASTIVVSLLIVVGLAYLSLRSLQFLSKGGGRTTGRTGAIKVWDTVPLSPQRTLYLVSVGERYLLVGGTDQQLSPLAEFRGEELEQAGPFAAALSDARGDDHPGRGWHEAFDAARGLHDTLRRLQLAMQRGSDAE